MCADSSGFIALLGDLVLGVVRSVSQLTTSPVWVTNRRSRSARCSTNQFVRLTKRVSVPTSCWVSGYTAKLNVGSSTPPPAPSS